MGQPMGMATPAMQRSVPPCREEELSPRGLIYLCMDHLSQNGAALC